MTLQAAYDPALPHAAGLVFGSAAGGALGLLHFAALEWTVRCFASGRVLHAAALQLGRFALLAAGFAGLAQLDAGPLLAGLVGLLLARRVLLRRMGSVPAGCEP